MTTPNLKADKSDLDELGELNLTAHTYRDEQNNKFTQVTATCKCGRGGWIRLPHHPSQTLIEDRCRRARVEQLKELISDREMDYYADMSWEAHIDLILDRLNKKESSDES
jgi:hypothetical protein